MESRSPRLQHGTLYRFDSATEILNFCRTRYPSADVWSETLDDEFVLRVRCSEVEFESLIVHFDGERCYAVMLTPVPLVSRPTGLLSDRTTRLE